MSVIGWIGATLLAICGIPEAVRTYKAKKCYVGWGMLLTWYWGEILTFIYVLPKGDIPLILNYIVNIAFISIMMYYKLKEFISEQMPVLSETMRKFMVQLLNRRK